MLQASMLTLAMDNQIGAYETRLAASKPWVGGVARRAA